MKEYGMGFLVTQEAGLAHEMISDRLRRAAVDSRTYNRHVIWHVDVVDPSQLDPDCYYCSPAYRHLQFWEEIADLAEPCESCGRPRVEGKGT